MVGSLLSLGLCAAPLLLLSTGTAVTRAAPQSAGGGRAAADILARPHTHLIQSLKLAFQTPISTTTTTVPPPPSTTTTTVPPPPSTTTTVPPPANANTATGIATWYSQAPAGTCASPWLPKGVSLRVTDLATGTTIICIVEDREADNPGRVVDLSPSGFEALAPLSQGVVQVTVSW